MDGVLQVPRVRARAEVRRVRLRSAARGARRRGHRRADPVERPRDGDDAVLLGVERPVPAGAAVSPGAQAFHRWLADYAVRRPGPPGSHRRSPGRVSTWRRRSRSCGGCAAAGFSGVYLPGAVHDPALPPHHDRYFDPFWAACEELGLVLVLHAAFGAEQGRVLDMLRRKAQFKETLVARNPELAGTSTSPPSPRTSCSSWAAVCRKTR